MNRENEVDGSAYTKRLSVTDANDAQCGTPQEFIYEVCVPPSARGTFKPLYS